MNSEYFSQISMNAAATAEQDDPIGRATLHRMASVDRYNRWIYEEIAPFSGRRLLEVGCGIGNMTDFFLDLEEVVGVDPLVSSVHNITAKYAKYPNVHIYQGDITTGETVEKLIDHRFDTIICLNVLEHIEQDQLALRHMYDLLVPGGRLLLFVPAGQFMYGSLDIALGHFCRYDQATLDAKVQQAGFTILKSSYMNLAGIPGWWLNSRVLKRNILPIGQLQLFNILAPFFIAFEHSLRKVWDAPIGQSLLCIGQKQ
ncbi:MAG: class I SAM-dependent methyltransferase [Caldilineaceae bacterium]